MSIDEHTVILDPTAPQPRARSQAKPLATLEDKVIGFIDNSKPNFDYLVDDLGELLVTRYGAASVVKHRKRAPSHAAGAEVFADIRKKCDIVIAGSGD